MAAGMACQVGTPTWCRSLLLRATVLTPGLWLVLGERRGVSPPVHENNRRAYAAPLATKLKTAGINPVARLSQRHPVGVPTCLPGRRACRQARQTRQEADSRQVCLLLLRYPIESTFA
jgi:hypothetical protein